MVKVAIPGSIEAGRQGIHVSPFAITKKVQTFYPWDNSCPRGFADIPSGVRGYKLYCDKVADVTPASGDFVQTAELTSGGAAVGR